MNTGKAHADIARIALLLREAGLLPPPDGMDIQATRAHLARIAQFAGKDSIPLQTEPTLTLPAHTRQVPCKLYWPDKGHAPALMFYCHGGGFRHGALAGWDAPLRQLVRDSGIAVLSIEYALAPEYPFPAAFNEVTEVARHIIQHRAIDGRAVSRFAFGGDSAGANLALGATIMLRHAGITSLEHLLLFYGVYSRDTTSESWRRLGNFNGHGLSADSMRAYWQSYLQQDEDDWRVQPINGALGTLPRTRLVVGDLDPLVDENLLLSERLASVGADAALAVYPGIIHGVLRFNELAPVVRDMIRTEAEALRDTFFSGV